MKIEKLKDLDIGMSNIEIEGDVTYTNFAKNWTGEKGGRKYNFWSQFVALEDDTGSMGCNITFKKEEKALEEGDHAKIRGKLEEYEDNEGNMQKKLSGHVVKGNKTEEKKEEDKEEKEENVKKEKTNNVQGDVDLHIVRECAIKASVELIVADVISPDNLFLSSEKIVDYIYNGYQEVELIDEEKIKPLLKKIGELRHENFLEKDEAFNKVVGLNKKLEGCSEGKLIAIIDKLKNYVPDFSVPDKKDKAK